MGGGVGILRRAAGLVFIAVCAAGAPARAAELPLASADHRGVRVLVLAGSREAMAAQHGAFVRAEGGETAVPYFARKIPNQIAQAWIAQDFPFLASAFQRLIDWVVLRPLRAAIPEADARAAIAFASAAGYPERDVLGALVLPDAGQWLTTRLFRANSLLQGVFVPIPALGCSTFFVPAGRSSTGVPLLARNLDYEGYGIFDRRPAVLYSLPEAPGELPYVSVTSLGLHTAGITGANDAGLILTLHQTMVNRVTLRAPPILATTESVLRRARTLDEAIALLRASEYAGSWRIVLTSTAENRSASVEVGHGAVEVFEEPGLRVETNHVRAASMREREYSISYRYFEDTRLRERALRAALSRAGDRVTPAVASAILAGHRDADGAPRSTHGVPAKLNNIQSVVFSPGENRLYVAVPPLQDGKPLGGRFVPLPLRASALASEAALREALAEQPPDIDRGPDLPPAKARAHAAARLAARLATEEGRNAEALALIEQAADLDPSEPHYPIVAAAAWLHVAGERFKRRAEGERANGGPPGAALAEMERWIQVAERAELSVYHQALVHLLRGRLFDARGLRSDAVAEYRSVRSGISALLDRDVQKNLRHPYRLAEARKVVVDWIHGDLLRF